jgi:hypothetical protein
MKELRYIKHNGGASYRVAILGGLETMMLQSKFHLDPHTSGITLSYAGEHLNKKKQDSINTSLRILLDKFKKADLLTDRVYTYTLKGIDSGNYVAELQLIGDLTEMSSRLKWLAPNRLLPLAEDLHKNGIVSDSSFLRLENDINKGKIESAFQLNGYCQRDRVFDLAKYPDEPDLWLEQMHRDMASIVPGLNFTDFSYTTIPDTSFSLPGVRFKVSLMCNGHTYKHTSITFNNFKSRQGKITPKDIVVEDFYRIFNKVLTDQQSPFRLYSVMFSPGTTAEDHFRHFALIALNEAQFRVFMTKPFLSYMYVSLENYDGTLTSAKINSTIAGWRKIGLFAHLSGAEINKATDDAEAADPFSISNLLSNFPGVIYNLLDGLTGPKYPYKDILMNFAKITHGAFNPTKIIQRKVKGGLKLQYLAEGKTHSYTFPTAYGLMDVKFPAFMKNLSRENNLTKPQYNDAVKYKFLDFEPMILNDSPGIKTPVKTHRKAGRFKPSRK